MAEIASATCRSQASKLPLGPSKTSPALLLMGSRQGGSAAQCCLSLRSSQLHSPTAPRATPGWATEATQAQATSSRPTALHRS